MGRLEIEGADTTFPPWCATSAAISSARRLSKETTSPLRPPPSLCSAPIIRRSEPYTTASRRPSRAASKHEGPRGSLPGGLRFMTLGQTANQNWQGFVVGVHVPPATNALQDDTVFGMVLLKPRS